MRVGLLHPRSGIAGMWAPSMDAAAQIGAAEINSTGGILGDQVELVFADCGFSVSEALHAVDTLLDIEDVDAIVGGHASNVRDAVSRRVSDQVPYIYTPQYEGIACGPSTVAIGSTDAELMGPALHWLRTEKHAERYFFVGNDYIWPRMALATTRALSRKIGASLVGDAIISMQMEDYSELFRQIRQSGAQVVVQALLGQSCVEFNRAFAAAGLDEKMLRFGLIVDETIVCAIGADASTNLFTAASYFAGQRSRQNDRFLELYHDAFGELAPPVSAASVGCYAGLHVLAHLARDVQTRNSRMLAHHLSNPMPRPTVRHMLDKKQLGQWPSVYIGQADGVTLQVIATFAP